MNIESVSNQGLSDNRYLNLKVYTLIYNALFLNYKNFKKHCTDIEDYLGYLDFSLQQAYKIDEYLHKIMFVCKCLKHAAEMCVDTNPSLCLCINQIAEEINRNSESWDLEDHLLQLRNIGRDLAKEFYKSEDNIVIKDINFSDIPIVLTNYYVTEPDEIAQLAVRANKRINVSFLEYYKYHDYISFPIVFMHEYVSHIMRPPSTCVMFDDGWLMYAIECYLRHQMQLLPEDLPIQSSQIAIIDRDWKPKWDKNGSVINGYLLAEEFDLHAIGPEKFLNLTRDLAMYPEDFQGIRPFQLQLMRLISDFIPSNRGKRVLIDATNKSHTALELYLLLHGLRENN